MPNKFALISLAQSGDERALGILINENMGLVAKVVRRFLAHGTDQELDDLMQVGAMGLLKAIRNFKIDLGYQFSTYAFPCIIGELRRYLLKQAPLKVSKDFYQLGKDLRQRIHKETITTGQEPRLSEISKHFAISEEEALLAMEALRSPLSLEADILAENNASLQGYQAQEEVDLEKISVRQALESLDDRSRNLIYLRYFKGLTQEQTGTQMGLSQVHVSRLEKQIIAKMKVCLQ